MPNSMDNQDYGKSDEKNKATGQKAETGPSAGNIPLGKDQDNLTSDDLKGKKVDADPSKESGKPAHNQ